MSEPDYIVSATTDLTQHLQILRCPVSHEHLFELPVTRQKELNDLIKAGRLRYSDATPVVTPLTQALISESGTYIYRVENNILYLLLDLAIVVNDGSPHEMDGPSLAPEKSNVRDYYDQKGWEEDSSGQYYDTKMNVHADGIVADYYNKCNRRLMRYLDQGGRYLLDVASGPTVNIGNSERFDYHICVDFSTKALYGAQKKLREKGLYIVGDITNLPLSTDSMDSIISLHTIYHVPAGEQLHAFTELHRTLKPGSTAFVVYSWGDRSPLMNLSLFAPRLVNRGVRRLRRMFTKKNYSQKSKLESESPKSPSLYFHPHSYGWLKRELSKLINFEIVTHQSIRLLFIRIYIHRRFFGKQILALIFWFEERFPHFFGRYGQYPLIIIDKPTSMSKSLKLE